MWPMNQQIFHSGRQYPLLVTQKSSFVRVQENDTEDALLDVLATVWGFQLVIDQTKDALCFAPS